MLIPALCPECAGRSDTCHVCAGTGKAAFELPDSGPAFTRRCPTCGWCNGMYFPQAGMVIPIDGARLSDTDFANSCLECRVRGQMVWQRLD